MADSSRGDVQFVTVVCRVCGTRLDERVGSKPREVACPDCLTPCRVPSLAELPKANRPRTVDDAGTYRLVRPDAPPTDARPRRRKRVDPSVPGATVLVVCPICHARVDEIPRRMPRTVTCPDCHELVRIPSQEEVEARRERDRRNHRSPEPIEALHVPQAEAPPELRTRFIETQAEIRREKVPDAPRWTFFTRVFSIPWHREVLNVWLWLSLGLTIMIALAMYILELTGEASNLMYLVIAFLALPMVWISLWTLSLAASSALTIIEDTANGNDRTFGWEDHTFRDWMLRMVWLGSQWLLAIVIGLFVARVLLLSGAAFLIVHSAVTWVLFPVFLMSALEGNSVFTPLTGPIVASLFRLWWGWAVYYLLSLLLLGGWEAAWGVGLRFLSPYVVALLMGPLTAAMILIWARLLGRMGWLITRPANRDKRNSTRSTRR